MPFRVRPEAEADIENIALYIAADSPMAAKKWFDDIYRRCRGLGEMPGMGVARSDVRPDLRMFPAGKYLILYREVDGGAEIVRVIHGARQWQELL
ncbi:plasmid stabilization protein [Labrys miyagiensis]|uniref:Plasmid stabilization protein n=1 Tax=Labrys miyagiensis TaxID=346912 RepID=A0ABQ6CAI0_9HYPH|nr:type II toxin-antitoxin system RelE/ParE family toxin [Labrys miyagiensis]GLS17150.1 plasmid stabilization protein [Labrys miyagiensis]